MKEARKYVGDEFRREWRAAVERGEVVKEVWT